MVEGCGMKCLKYLVFVFNLAFVACGLVLIIIGSVMQSRSPVPFAVAIFIIVVGIIIFIIAFVGCCGAIRENRCLLISFGVILIVIMVLCIIAFIVGLVFRADAAKLAHTVLLNCIHHYDTVEPIRSFMDSFQQAHDCCGSKNYTDWSNNPTQQQTNSVPDSCCKEKFRAANCGKDGLVNPKIINEKGCASELGNFIQSENLSIAIAAIIISVILAVGIVFAFCLANAVKGGGEYTTV